MKKLTRQEQYNWLIETLDSFISLPRLKKDKDIEYELYENLEVDVTSVFHKNTLDRLVTSGFISKSVKAQILKLRLGILKLIDKHRDRDIKTIRTSKDWLKVIEKIKAIRADLK